MAANPPADASSIAYVLNMASNGDHYWVFAHVTPTFAADGTIIGYHSNRRVPEPKALQAIVLLYAELKAIEDRTPNRAQGLTDSTAALARFLQHGTEGPVETLSRGFRQQLDAGNA